MSGLAGLVFAGLLAVAAGGCTVIGTAAPPTPVPTPKPTPTPQRPTVQVRRGTIVDAIKVLGRVTASQEADLSFRNSGRIRDVYVQPGDMVQPGQVLAELDQRDLPWQLARARVNRDTAQLKLAAAQAKQTLDDTAIYQLNVQSAQIGLALAQLNLERLKAGPQDQEVKKAQADVTSAQAALDRARFDLADKQAQLAAKQAQLAAMLQGPDPVALAQAKADLELAKIKLEQAQAGPKPEDVKAAQIALDQEKTKLEKLKNQPKVRPEDVEAARLQVEVAKAQLDKVLADIDAGAIKGEVNKDTAVRNAQAALQQAQNTYDKLRGAGPTPEELKQQEDAVRLAELQLQKVSNPASYDVGAAQAAVAAAQAKLDQLQAGPTDADLAPLRSQIDALGRTIETAKQAIQAAQAGLQAAQARLDLVMRGPSDFDLQDAQNKVAQAQTAVALAQAKLKTEQDTIAQARTVASYDVRSLQQALDQTTLDVQNYESQTGDVKITAPFAGRITRLAARPGDTVQAFFPILTVSSLEGLVVKADIAEADLPRLQVGMPVDLTMDAYPNQTLHGRIDALPELTVGQVGQAPDKSTRIVVDWPGPGAEMGMLARVQITLLVKPDVLIVPNSAVHTVGKRTYVEYMDGDIKRSRNVQVGIVTESETEIVSGLEEGMTILSGESSS